MNLFKFGMVAFGTLFASLTYAESTLMEKLLIEGRVEFDEQGAITMGYPGITVHSVFQGRGLSLKIDSLNEDLYLDVSVDGQPFYWIALEKGEQVVEIPVDKMGEHSVEIVRRNETWQGMIKLISVQAIEGALIEPTPLPMSKLMFIGDSITCGDSCDIREEGPHTRGFEHNGRIAYGYLISRMLNTQCHLVSYGGRGVIRDWQGIRATNNAPQFYERTLADEATSRWDHASYVPDVIGICLGTNDFSSGIPDEHLFVSSYVELVCKIAKDAPEAKILLIDSPMLGADDLKRQVLSHYLDQVVEQLADPDVQHVALGHFPGRPENAHPIASEHQQIAQILAPHFKAALESTH